jgi:hypothetical protein
MEDNFNRSSTDDSRDNRLSEQRMTERQRSILASLVAAARCSKFDASNPFLAVRIGLAGIAIHHPAIEPINSLEMADVDHLGQLAFLDLRRLPSGARIFTITDKGFKLIDGDRDVRALGVEAQ